MASNIDVAVALQGKIKQVLMNDWDPIGVAGVPEASDEYDSYVNHIYRLLIRRTPVDEIIRYLWEAETQRMGLCGDPSRTRSVGQRLASLANAPVPQPDENA